MDCPTMLLSLCLFASGPPAFERTVVDSEVSIGYGVAVADVDGDGRADIVLADKDVIAWYRNPQWEKYEIARKLTDLDHVCVDARDIDGDGKAEIAAGAGWNPANTEKSGSVHALVAPADRRQPWEPVTLPHEPTVHRMRWIRAGANEFALLVAPLHGCGNVNAEGAGVKIQLYHPRPGLRGHWRIEILDGALHATHNVDPVAWDDDPEDEVLVAAREGLFLLDRGMTRYGTVRWSRKEIVTGPGFPGASEVRHGRGPGGRRFLVWIEPFHGSRLMCATALPTDGAWLFATLADDLAEGHALACGDLLGRGHDQIVVGWRSPNAKGSTGLRLYDPRWDGGFDLHVIDDDGIACEDARLADIDGDGRLDIVASGRATKNLVVYRNTTAIGVSK